MEMNSFFFCFQTLMKGNMGFMQLGGENMISASEYKGIHDEKCNITKVR